MSRYTKTFCKKCKHYASLVEDEGLEHGVYGVCGFDGDICIVNGACEQYKEHDPKTDGKKLVV